LDQWVGEVSGSPPIASQLAHRSEPAKGLTPGNNGAETALVGWGTRIRTWDPKTTRSQCIGGMIGGSGNRVRSHTRGNRAAETALGG
jgi:hypothetical protein